MLLPLIYTWKDGGEGRQNRVEKVHPHLLWPWEPPDLNGGLVILEKFQPVWLSLTWLMIKKPPGAQTGDKVPWSVLGWAVKLN
jgi:hypothetical protein